MLGSWVFWSFRFLSSPKFPDSISHAPCQIFWGNKSREDSCAMSYAQTSEMCALGKDHPPIHLFIYPSTYPSVHPSIQPSNHLSICPLTYPSIHLFIHPSTYPSAHWPIPTIHPSLCLLTYPFIHAFIHLSTHPSIHRFTSTFNDSFISPIHITQCSWYSQIHDILSSVGARTVFFV